MLASDCSFHSCLVANLVVLDTLFRATALIAHPAGATHHKGVT